MLYQTSFRTPQKAYQAPATNTSGCMLFREPLIVYCENNKEHVDTLRGQKVTFTERTFHLK
jgi:hypothetical protein